ncbi:MAG: hypothetical protein ACI9T8_000355 [Candidatus Saccharimonadales bacterium]|jgi:hypothetical protein
MAKRKVASKAKATPRTNKRKASNKASKPRSSSISTSPFSNMSRKSLTLLVVGIGIVAAFFIYRANAGAFTTIVATGSETNCTSAIGTRLDEVETGAKKNFHVCEINSGSEQSPVQYLYDRNKTGTHTRILDALTNRGYNRAKTCVYIKSTSGTASVDLYGLGKQGTMKTISPTTGDYQEFCTTQSIEGTNQNILVKVNSGTARVSSLIIEGQTVVTAPTDGPIALTLNDNNVGPASGTSYQSVGTLYIDEAKVYSGYRASSVVVTREGRGATLRDSIITGGSAYTIDTTDGFTHSLSNPDDFVMERVYAKQNDDGKVILGGGFTLRRSHIVGGEDGLHLTTGKTLVQESIIEQQNHIGDSHADAIQLTSGGSGGSLTVEDSVLQAGFRSENAALQINVINGPVVSRRNYYHGGVYHILGDSQSHSIQSIDDMFAYGTAQYGLVGVGGVTKTRQVWWSRQVRPKTGSPYSTRSGEAPGFPGNGSPATQDNGFFTLSQTSN